MNFDNKFILLFILCIFMLIGYGIFKIFDKKCSYDKKIFLMYVFLILGCAYYISFFVICLGPFIPIDSTFFESGMAVVVFFAGSIFVEIMYLLMDSISIIASKPDKYILQQNNYEIFSWYLCNRLKLFRYKNILKEEGLNVYKKQVDKDNFYIIDYKTDELTKEKFKELYDSKIYNIVNSDLDKARKKVTYCVNIIYIVSVDRVSSYFNEFLNGLEQRTRSFILPVGISFGGKKIYFSSEFSNVNALSLEHLKKEIKEILEIGDKKIKFKK